MKRKPTPAHINHKQQISKKKPRPSPLDCSNRESNTSWDHVSAWYDKLVGDEGSDYHRHVVLPAVVEMLQPITGQRILDVCCGQGVLCRRLIETKAAEVVGVDISEKLIAAARQREKKNSPIQYLLGDVTQLRSVVQGTFDAAACVLALHDLEDIDSVLNGIAGVLKPGGRLVMVIMHPCFRIPRQSSWGWDENKKVQYRRLDRYASAMKIPITTHPGRRSGEQTIYFHRPLMNYFHSLGRTGFSVTDVQEMMSHRRIMPGGHSRGVNRAAEEFPVFLALKAEIYTRS